MEYRTELIEGEISAEEYLEKYVRPEEFVEYCRQCPNHNRIWSCPEYDFDTREIFRRYKKLRLFGLKIVYSDEARSRSYTREEMGEVIRESMMKERKRLDSVLSWYEDVTDGYALNAGACTICAEGCTRPEGKPCRFPEKRRYSLESLGADVSATLSEVLGTELKWDSEGRLPEYYTLVAGLLYDKN